jgi:hypothetical protein
MNTVIPASGDADGLPRTSVRWIAASASSPRPTPDRLLCRPFRQGIELAWSPVDAVLAARGLSNLVVMGATLAVAILSAGDGGLTAVTMNLPALAVIWGAAYGLIRLGRWWRGVRPAEHEPPSRQR